MEDSGEPMTGMLDTNAPDNGDAPAMEGTGADYGTDPTATDWTAPPANPESHECEQIQQPSALEQNQLYSMEHLKSAAENIDRTASPADPGAESLGQQTESNGQQDEAKPAGAGDSESPTNMELEDAPKETAEAEEPATDTAATHESELPADYERLFKVVEDNPEDFNGWVYLLQYVEQENHLVASRKAFDDFFLHYPYCYGYWKKYADIEKKHGYVHLADEVYRRGLQAIPLSVDLWLHYITFLRENQDTSDGEAENRIRASYEHAVLACGTDFRSDRLWEAYIAWETEQGKLANVTAVYDRILCIPTQLYSQHFQKLASNQGLGLKVGRARDEMPPSQHRPELIHWRVTEIENMRHKVTETRQEVFNHNEHEVSKRWAFEEGRFSIPNPIHASVYFMLFFWLQTNPKLYLNLLELEYSGDVQQNEAEIMACFDRALSSTMQLEQRLIFSQRKLEFLEDFGSDVNLLVAAYEQHQRLVTEQESLKRKAENGEEPDSKRQRTDDQSGASGQMMQDTQANHAGYNYNNWYQYNSWGGQSSWGQYGQYNQYYPPPPT
ncbi:pre-mRNA-processing factor 39-like [Sinocyclocheilus grahami]|uniref:pre-mRNA-processing factor 39-like n=1 Tax=Sinocyclocheilus grahami TaxID=75366 RepID=UPI0007ACF26B|nr:PREDICTED: pre-mRNA-processing factor 39-like [Sinocyclocheilus grahami]